jgi:glycosyltransferase involved in cell wall biosynthesis
MPYFGIESMACKNPLITFDIGGCSEMVDHKKSGWVSKPFDINNFTKGIQWILSDSKRHKELSENARNFVIRKFNYKDFINKYKTVVND